MSDSARTTIYKGECLHIYRDPGQFPNLEITLRLAHESNVHVIVPAPPSLIDVFRANEILQRDIKALRAEVDSFTGLVSRVTRAKDEEINKLSEQIRKAEQAFFDQRNFSVESPDDMMSKPQAIPGTFAIKDAEICQLRNQLAASRAEAEYYRLKLGKKAED